MKVVAISHDPKSVVRRVEEEFDAVIERFIQDNPMLQVATLIGVLRCVEQRLMNRLYEDEKP